VPAKIVWYGDTDTIKAQPKSAAAGGHASRFIPHPRRIFIPHLARANAHRIWQGAIRGFFGLDQTTTTADYGQIQSYAVGRSRFQSVPSAFRTLPTLAAAREKSGAGLELNHDCCGTPSQPFLAGWPI